MQLGDEADRAEPGRVDRGDAGVVARLLEQQAAVLGGDPAGGEDAVVVGVGVDVRHAVDVAGDLDAGMAGNRLERARAVGAEAVERLRLEVGRQIAVGDLVEERRQAVVHRRLGVVGHRRRRLAGLELTRGDDVQGGCRVVLGGRNAGEGQHRDQCKDDRAQTLGQGFSSYRSPVGRTRVREGDDSGTATASAPVTRSMMIR